MNHTDIIRALTKEDLMQLVDVIGKDGKLSISSVLKHYKVSAFHTTCRRIVSDKFKEHKIGVHGQGSARRSYTCADVVRVLGVSSCWSDVFRGLEISTCGHNKKHVLRLMQEYGIIEPQFDVKSTYQRGKDRHTFATIFCIDSSYARTALRGAALRFKVKEYCCNKCGNEGQWQGEEITIELDHINGISNDNRVENLRWLCPNCHSQTKTYKNSNNGSVA